MKVMQKNVLKNARYFGMWCPVLRICPSVPLCRLTSPSCALWRSNLEGTASKMREDHVTRQGGLPLRESRWFSAFSLSASFRFLAFRTVVQDALAVEEPWRPLGVCPYQTIVDLAPSMDRLETGDRRQETRREAFDARYIGRCGTARQRANFEARDVNRTAATDHGDRSRRQ